VAYYCDLSPSTAAINLYQQHLSRLRVTNLTITQQAAAPKAPNQLCYFRSVTIGSDEVRNPHWDMAAASAAPDVELPPGQVADRRCRHGRRTMGKFRHCANILRTWARVERLTASERPGSASASNCPGHTHRCRSRWGRIHPRKRRWGWGAVAEGVGDPGPGRGANNARDPADPSPPSLAIGRTRGRRSGWPRGAGGLKRG
jgi:hypothetical protein